MIIVKGVEMMKVCRQIKKVLKIIETIFDESRDKLIIKGTRMGFDKRREAHESGRAIDIEFPTYMLNHTATRLAFSLGLNYIVRRYDNHLHIEWAPMSKEAVKVERWVHQLLDRSKKKC